MTSARRSRAGFTIPSRGGSALATPEVNTVAAGTEVAPPLVSIAAGAGSKDGAAVADPEGREAEGTAGTATAAGDRPS